MNITVRLLLAFLIVVLASVYVLYDNISQIELGLGLSTEETMVDTANLLAELIEEEFVTGSLVNLQEASHDYTTRSLTALIKDVSKTNASLRVYVTDSQGIVMFDSEGETVGQDFSQWNDIYLTLRGRYGARATRIDPGDEMTTVLHVGAPIVRNDEIVGVVSVAKSKESLSPYIEYIRETIVSEGSKLLLYALCICLVLAFWLTHSIRKLVTYANNVVGNTGPPPPAFSEPEFKQLSEAMQAMRHRLDGKEYVEQYIESLTHEIKSPVAAIKGALELIDADMPATDREKFLANIHHEIDRLETIASRLLHLAELEHKATLDQQENVDLADILAEQVSARELLFKEKALQVVEEYKPATVTGDSFLLKQAVNNILDNAITHAPQGSTITLGLTNGPTEGPTISIRDEGPGIPDYALPKVFDRFFSLPHPTTGKKSSGLGLSFVRQILDLHNAEITLTNQYPGVEAKITFHTQST